MLQESPEINNLYQKYNKILDKNSITMQLLTFLSSEIKLFDPNNVKDDSGIENIANFLEQYKKLIDFTKMEP